MGEGGQLIAWLTFLFNALVLLAVVGVALGLVRRASATGAYALAAAAGVQLLLSCCARVTRLALSGGVDRSALNMATGCLDMLGGLVTVALLAFAFVTLSRAITAPAAPAKPAAPV
jgi:hypothetical protein